MKKRSSIHLLGLTMLYMLGTMGIFSSYYTLHHRTVFQSLVKSAHESGLEEVVVTEAEYRAIQWIEKDTEFEWKGKLHFIACLFLVRVHQRQEHFFEAVILALDDDISVATGDGSDII
jgi:hypothetical protein